MLNKKLSFFVLPFVATLSLHANDPFFQDPFGDDIFKEMMQMQQNMDKMFNRMHTRIQQRSRSQIAPLGTYRVQEQSQFVDKDDIYKFVTTIPESKENQIDVNTENGIISITAKIIQKQENKTVNGYSSSSSMRMYQQSIPLPVDADQSTINMGYVDGKLVISVKKLKNVSKTVPMNSNNTSSKNIEKNIEPKKQIESNETKEQNSTKKKTTINSDESSMS